MKKHITQCLDSIFAQTLEEIEVICIDDGSNDGTLQILEKYIDEHSNMYVIKQERQGAGKARNKGIEIANGEFVAFMDSDDYYPSIDVLDVLYRNALKNGVMMAGGSMLTFFEGKEKATNKQIYEGNDRIIKSKEDQNPYGFYRFIYNRSMLVDNGILFPDYIRNQDPIFKLRAMIKSDRMWITSNFTYAHRIYDKKLDYSSERVIGDIVKGFIDIMEVAKNVHYYNLQEEFVNSFENWQYIIMAHIVNGNIKLLEYVKKLGDCIIDDEKRRDFLEFWEYDNIISISKKRMALEAEYRNIIRNRKRVIIYGAGERGKTVYDFIQPMEDVIFMGFAVSNRKPNMTVRGNRVRSIYDYLDIKKEALLIISVNEKQMDDMKSLADKLGYINILQITENLTDFENFKITSQKFAV
jgi:glycosyltransferase involved in cell wall biosynthesis